MLLVVSKYLVPKGYRGLTFFPFVFIRDSEDKKDEVLINHEQIHLRQQLEMGIFLFYFFYFLDFVFQFIRYKNMAKAYRNICFEKEAYANEKNFKYLKTRGFWGFLKYFG